MRIVALVQARMGSTRLPGKVMTDICGVPAIELLISRLRLSKLLDEIVVCTSDARSDDELDDFLSAKRVSVFRGSEHDLLHRLYEAARESAADLIVRVTGDCPLLDPELVDTVISNLISNELDYCTNTLVPTYPDGFDVEVMTFAALESRQLNSTSLFEREHVTPFIRESGQFEIRNVAASTDYGHLRLTLDEARDLKVIREVCAYFTPSRTFSLPDILTLYSERPEIFTYNIDIVRNEGAQMSSGQKLYRRAKSVIPGGNMLLSKRPEMFLPDIWPSYFSKAKGCSVWDLDEIHYVDMSIMGIGTNTLGYACDEVDNAVASTIRKSNMSTLNAPEEVYLAERLIQLHPWADMVRFARTGGEANAVAIRIARAAAGRDKVAICGYHGWHDWYLSANHSSEANLNEHLLPGLSTEGVPRELAGSVIPFSYNDYEALASIVDNHDVGVIKMEVSRSEPPVDGFLEKVRELASRKNIVLIFDECTSGFRETNGGLHKKYGVEPDIAMFGKALGNGYAVTAVIGRRDVMEAAQKTFISSTFWTERIGSVAALATLDKMQEIQSWKLITETGIRIKAGWADLASAYNLGIEVSGLSALPVFSVGEGAARLEYKTLITQEMLKAGFLAGNSVYVSIAHTEDKLDKYFENLEPIFALIADCESGRRYVSDLLDGDVCHGGFKRLN